MALCIAGQSVSWQLKKFLPIYTFYERDSWPKFQSRARFTHGLRLQIQWRHSNGYYFSSLLLIIQRSFPRWILLKKANAPIKFGTQFRKIKTYIRRFDFFWDTFLSKKENLFHSYQTQICFEFLQTFEKTNQLLISSLPSPPFRFDQMKLFVVFLIFVCISSHIYQYQIDKDQTFFSQRRRSLWSNSYD